MSRAGVVTQAGRANGPPRVMPGQSLCSAARMSDNSVYSSIWASQSTTQSRLNLEPVSAEPSGVPPSTRRSALSTSNAATLGRSRSNANPALSSYLTSARLLPRFVTRSPLRDDTRSAASTSQRDIASSDDTTVTATRSVAPAPAC